MLLCACLRLNAILVVMFKVAEVFLLPGNKLTCMSTLFGLSEALWQWPTANTAPGCVHRWCGHSAHALQGLACRTMCWVGRVSTQVYFTECKLWGFTVSPAGLCCPTD